MNKKKKHGTRHHIHTICIQLGIHVQSWKLCRLKLKKVKGKNKKKEGRNDGAHPRQTGIGHSSL